MAYYTPISKLHPKWNGYNIGDTPIFDFHDYGRTCTLRDIIPNSQTHERTHRHRLPPTKPYGPRCPHCLCPSHKRFEPQVVWNFEGWYGIGIGGGKSIYICTIKYIYIYIYPKNHGISKQVGTGDLKEPCKKHILYRRVQWLLGCIYIYKFIIIIIIIIIINHKCEILSTL